MRVFVTGVAGFIGTHLALELQRAGAVVTGCDPKWTRGHTVTYDRRPVEEIKAVDCDTIVHLAALTDAGHPDNTEMWDRNMGAAAAVCWLAEQAGARLVVASSAAASMPASSAYAASKWALEQLALTQDATVLRYANVHGSGGRGVIERWVRAAAAGESIRVSGDGSQTRDFIRVEEVARVTAAAALNPAGDGLVVDVCTGVQTPILALAEAHLKPIEFVPRRSGDPDRVVQDPTLMRELYDTPVLKAA